MCTQDLNPFYYIDISPATAAKPPNSTRVFDKSSAGTISLIVATTILAVLLTGFLKLLEEKSPYPLANPPGWFQTRMSKQIEFLRHGLEVFEKAKKIYGDNPYRLITEQGEVLVLPPSYGHKIRNEKDLSFELTLLEDFNGHLQGFEPIDFLCHDKQIIQTVVRKQLTKYLNTVTEPISSECTFAVRSIFGTEPEWKEICIKDATLDLIARVSSRVFLGEELCRNPEWIGLTKEYTANAFSAGLRMSLVPKYLVRVYSWFSADARVVRKNSKDSRRILTPVVEKRKAIKAQAQREGLSIKPFEDALEWAELESQGAAFDMGALQLLMSFAAIHTTTDLLTQTLIRLANQPELIERLREEIINVIRVESFNKGALFNMKLLDSALKETQRVKPNGLLLMRRMAMQRIALPDGLVVLKGERVTVDASNMTDPQIYEDPEKYDIERYARMRDNPETANKAHLVSTGVDNLTFGHGIHACPGRFFAANEMKIALCHLFLKYDWKLAPGTSLKPVSTVGVLTTLDPKIRLIPCFDVNAWHRTSGYHLVLSVQGLMFYFSRIAGGVSNYCSVADSFLYVLFPYQSLIDLLLLLL
ncbi:cytochrome P450 monooxygenase-like protein [Boeremia exigua]|uniref:cytochrome P450 monooxygenase-like protein n=1 Tax=Boeremia exigua TaxID=749465 RepID=UPI001E8CFFCE|nr:cytochrome P450 monooxygenase-like protein [Boeremia exigua]KAH6619964.1 cytochrome P450 monooxygenase-like protein [Boeremia exigua]